MSRLNNETHTAATWRWRVGMMIPLLAWLWFCGSCAPYRSARQTARDLHEFPPLKDAKQSREVYRTWAENEWAKISGRVPGNSRTLFQKGFLDGFVDAVEAGGNGEPPVVPPKYYWRVGFRTVMGDREIATWSEGFRQGARTALDGGYRDRALVPTTMRVMPDAVAETPWYGSVEGGEVVPEELAPPAADPESTNGNPKDVGSVEAASYEELPSRVPPSSMDEKAKSVPPLPNYQL